MTTTIILSFFLTLICLAGICIKILIKKDGEFSGTCASNNPFLNKDGKKCSYCGADPGERCKKDKNEEVK